ncbi:MAG: hypothetical protein HY553_19775 [Elusimicrobia bacterium]|nr:hypothetical protein [Elusimicrobiota bacterium]
MIRVRVKCGRCGKSLMDEGTEIDSRPSILVLAKAGSKSGALRLSSAYGSYRIRPEVDLKKGVVARFFCPHCKKEMAGSRRCDKCEAPMIPLALQEGGVVQICARRGCKKHCLEFEDPEAELRAFYGAYSTFYKG